jgi:ABC-type transport system involved in multi-copper enzyme maturation permease subunit
MLLFIFIGSDEMTTWFNIDSQYYDDLLIKVARTLQVLIVAPLFGGGLFLSIFSVSSFIPNMLEKGNIDLLLSKPITRPQLIIGKFLGGLLVVLINVAYLVFGIYVLIGLKFGVWTAAFLATIPIILLAFSALYSLIIVIGILTRSSILAMILSYFIFFILSPILAARDNISALLDNKFVEIILEGLYYVIPQTYELGALTADLAAGTLLADTGSVIVSLIQSILILYLSIIIFNKKDY